MEGSSSSAVSNFPLRLCVGDTSNSSKFDLDAGPMIDPPAKNEGRKHLITQASPMRKHISSWSPQEDEILREAVVQHKARNWRLTAKSVPNRTDIQCLHRWQKVLNPVLVKGYWTKEEDDKMLELVGMLGTKRWAAIARSLPGRNGKQCRERWCNHLDPKIKRDPWTEVEDMTLFLAQRRFGKKWAKISKLLPGRYANFTSICLSAIYTISRPDNSVKKRWNTAIKKKVKILEEYCRMWNQQNPSRNEELLDNETAMKDLVAIPEFFALNEQDTFRVLEARARGSVSTNGKKVLSVMRTSIRVASQFIRCVRRF